MTLSYYNNTWGDRMWNGDINNIDDVVLYMNAEFKKGRSQKDIEINDFKVNQGVIKNRLTRRGYKKVDNQWILNGDKSITKVIPENKPVEKKYDNGNTLVIHDNEIHSKLLKLAQNYDKLMSIIEKYDNEYDDTYDRKYDGITIELPIETKADYRTSIRVNNVIWEQFNEFTEDNKQFTKKDLLSMALKDYMNNHKKE